MCDPNPLPDFPHGNHHKHFRENMWGSVQNLLVPALFPHESRMNPSSFLQSSGKSAVVAAFYSQIWNWDSSGDTHSPLPEHSVYPPCRAACERRWELGCDWDLESSVGESQSWEEDWQEMEVSKSAELA